MSTLAQARAIPLPQAIGRFSLHFLEMCAAMCAGGLILDVLVFAAADMVGIDLVRTAPAASIAIIAIDHTISMALYMRFRGHLLRHNIEMSGANLVGGALLIAAFVIGRLPQTVFVNAFVLAAFLCGPLCLIMFGVMVARFDHYSGRAGAHGSHA